VSILSTWAVARDVEVALDDRDNNGMLLAASIESWIATAVDDYLDACPAISAAAAALPGRVRRTGTTPDPADLGHPKALGLSATISEVLPDRLILRVRLRPLEGDVDGPADAQCRIELIGSDGTARPVGNALRDEVIAVERGARFYN
jgi:hypothetical protein